MAFLGFVDTEAVERFAQTLADDLARRFPPESEKRSDQGAANQLKVILEGLGARAVRFKTENRLGIYRKAKLGTVFRYKLQALGYSDKFAEMATSEIIKRISVN